MKVALQLWALLFGSTIGVLAQIPEKPNFTGTWILDLQRSRFGEMAQPKSLMIQIEHNEPQIRILSVKIVGKDEEREALELLTNGEDTSFDAKPAPCSANAHWDQWTSTRLVVDVNCDGHAQSRRFTLGGKGKILTTVLTVKDSAAERKAYEFYSKAKD